MSPYGVITDIEKQYEEAESAFDVSKKYLGLKMHMDSLESADAASVEKAICALSAIYKNLAFLDDYGIYNDLDKAAELFQTNKKDDKLSVPDLGAAIYRVLSESFKCGEDAQRLLIVESPLGSYKNRLLKNIYLKIATQEFKDDVLPFYINVSRYEQFQNLAHEDITAILKIVKNNPQKMPVFIIDGVRSFACGVNDLYGELDKDIFEKISKYRLIVGVDYRFTENAEQNVVKYKGETPLVDHNATKYVVKINPMRLDMEPESIEFIEACIKAFKNEIPAIKDLTDLSAKSVQSRLVDLGLVYIDAHWLVKLLKEYRHLMLAQNITDLYNSIVNKFLGNENMVDEAAGLAYNFGLYGKYEAVKNNGVINEQNTYKEWELILKHKSVQDYFIARHYVNLLASVDLEKPKEQLVKDLGFFNRVFPKNITRFASYMIEAHDDLEEKILTLAKDEFYLNDSLMPVFAKSELTYWLGRLSQNNQSKAFAALRYLKRNSAKNYEEIKLKHAKNLSNHNEVKIECFLLRGIYVSLLYCKNVDNDPAIDAEILSNLNEYLLSLFTDKTSNEINRAFHLEYYNDINYKISPNNDDCIKKMKDNLAKGKNTFRKLIHDLSNKAGKFNVVSVLQLVTLCCLILARKPEKIDFIRKDTGEPVGEEKFYFVKDISERYDESNENYIKIHNINADLISCLGLLQTFKSSFIYSKLDNLVKGYFDWVTDEMNWLKCEIENARNTDKPYYIPYIETKTYNTFCNSVNVFRTGWLQRCVQRPESIAEHIYNCWLMGLLYLPEEGSNAERDGGYDKSAILNMLLIHDLGEVITGDIPRDVKTASDKVKNMYDDEESQVMYSVLLTGSYPFVNSTMSEYYDLWKAWANVATGKNLNAEIAKDIDNIQAVYQYCKYYLIRGNSRCSDNETFPIYNGENKEKLNAVPYVNMTFEDCCRWLSTVDADICGAPCVLKSERGKEISRKVIFENLGFSTIISDYKIYKNR
ncbi:MAG: HD domain-containing protein [Clostridia bacterium]|nr:HD domain-containing protein [Clostridia bacterium]